jgi:hypothetical protein
VFILNAYKCFREAAVFFHRVHRAENAAVGFDVLTTCQPSTVWCSRERLPAAAAQPAKVRQSYGATDLFIIYLSTSQGSITPQEANISSFNRFVSFFLLWNVCFYAVILTPHLLFLIDLQAERYFVERPHQFIINATNLLLQTGLRITQYFSLSKLAISEIVTSIFELFFNMSF